MFVKLGRLTYCQGHSNFNLSPHEKAFTPAPFDERLCKVEEAVMKLGGGFSLLPTRRKHLS